MKKLRPITVKTENDEVINIDTANIIDFKISSEKIIIFIKAPVGFYVKPRLKLIFNRRDFFITHWEGLIRDLEIRFEEGD